MNKFKVSLAFNHYRRHIKIFHIMNLCRGVGLGVKSNGPFNWYFYLCLENKKAYNFKKNFIMPHL